ncbi:MAG: hypothetical protein JNK72_19185 [Myxococcales bacterium]|nr:hypothetical protein [Myxococcales bacterium]
MSGSRHDAQGLGGDFSAPLWVSAAPWVFGLATWLVLGLLPALALGRTEAFMGALPAPFALAVMAFEGRRGARARALFAGAAGFPLALGLGALAQGLFHTARLDFATQLMGAAAALAFAASVALWWQSTAPRARVTAVPLEPSGASPPLASTPPLQPLGYALTALMGLGLSLVLPSWVVTARAGAALDGVAARRVMVLGVGLALSLAWVLLLGPSLLRRGPERRRNLSRAIWLMTGSLLAFAMKVWLDRAR